MVMCVGTGASGRWSQRLGSCLCAVVLLFWSATALWAAVPVCLRCHPQHYGQQGSCHRCHRGDERAARKDLAHHNFVPAQLASYRLAHSPARERGAKLAETLACRRCHQLSGQGNRLASDLDQVAATRSVVRLRAALATPAWYMPDFRLAAPEANDLLTYLLAIGEKAAQKPVRVESPERVHFVSQTAGRLVDPFSRHCGGCHQIVTKRGGGLGQGRVAPNLAGLLGEFYPRTYGPGVEWTRETLKSWLENPRASRPLATMLPVRLTPRDYAALAAQFVE